MFHQTISEIIEAKPIGNGLDAFRKSFTSIAKEAGHCASTEVLDQMSNEGKNLDYSSIALLTLIQMLRISLLTLC